jgi:hypothetical protein
MAFKPSVAIFDACILYPFHLRNIVVQIAVDRLVDARWTDEIHAEWIRNLSTNKPTVPIERLQMTRHLMDAALPSALVIEYKDHIELVSLPDPNDRHVVAPGIAAGTAVSSRGTCVISRRRNLNGAAFTGRARMLSSPIFMIRLQS